MEKSPLKFFFILILVFATLFAGAQNGIRNFGYKTEFKIPYCTVDGKTLTLNVFLPSNNVAPAPAMIDIHGGWWFAGGAATQIPETFTRKGIAVFSIEYRLGEEGGFPQNIRDCRNAVRFVRKNAARFNIDPDRIGCMGGSAGGHLSLMVAMVPEDFDDGGPTPGLEGVSARVANCYSNIPPTDFVRFWNEGPDDIVRTPGKKASYRTPDPKIPNDSRPRLRVLFHGVTPDTKKAKALYTLMSPVGNIHKGIPPLLICDGEKDPIVPGLEGKELYEKLQAAGISATYWMTVNGGHANPGGKGFQELLDKFLIKTLSVDTITQNKINSDLQASQYLFRNPKLSFQARVNDLLARMTTEEKINQMDMYWGTEVSNMKKHDAASYSEAKVLAVLGKTSIGSVHDFYPLSPGIPNEIQKYAKEKTRLGIPVMFIEEGLHGYCGNGSTAFPIPLQLASAWDTTLVRKVGHVIGAESRAHGVHMILAPVLDLARDPRWGRVEETYGEDPYLVALNGVAIVKGMQGSSLSQPDAVIAEPKHFAVHSVPEAGSNIGPVFVGEREARSNFLFTFEKAVREGGAKGIMAAYHELDGIPCVANKWLLTDVLRKEWGFTGFVLSDLGAIRMTVNSHMTAKDTIDALTQTIKAGMNMQFYDFSHKGFKAAINQALTNKTLSEEELNGAVRDILRVKFMLGLFENPYVDTLLVSKVFHSQENQDLALKAAHESIVLLKNQNSVLPLKNEKLRIAVIGELAESTYPGGYTSPGKIGISILDGLKLRAGAKQVISYEKGYTYNRNETANRQKAVDLAKASDVAVVVIGENLKIVGEGKDRSDISLGKDQMELIQAIHATGKPVVAVLFNGRPLVISWIAENIPAIVETWFSGEKGGLAIADVLFGKVNPSGKLPVTFPRSVGQIPFFYNHKPSSRHNYVDIQNSPQYPFGFGLSYTTFEYSGIKISPEAIPTDGTATVKISVKNTGQMEGTEVVQMYVRDEVSSVTTPVKSLKGFCRVTLQPGEVKEVSFKIGTEALWLWNREMKRVVEPGTFKIMIGTSSDDRRQQATLTVTETQIKLIPLAGESVALLTPDYTSPFNGKDLTGWCFRTKQEGETFLEKFDGKNESRDGRFTGRDGILSVNPWDEAKGPHYASIWTSKDYQGDFSYSIEFRAGVNADSGVYLRGLQLQCRDYLVAGPYKDLKKYKPQDWNKIEVVVRDNIAHCTCNGEILEDALKIPATGPLGVEADRGLMEYRNILIKALK